jgi:hypothetical protein
MSTLSSLRRLMLPIIFILFLLWKPEVTILFDLLIVAYVSSQVRVIILLDHVVAYAHVLSYWTYNTISVNGNDLFHHVVTYARGLSHWTYNTIMLMEMTCFTHVVSHIHTCLISLDVTDKGGRKIFWTLIISWCPSLQASKKPS